MQTHLIKIIQQSKCLALFKEVRRVFQDSSVWQALIGKGGTGVRKYMRFLFDIRKELRTCFNMVWQKSAIRTAIQKVVHLGEGIRKKIALNLNVSPVLLPVIRFVFLAQIVVLPFSSILSLPLLNWIWGGILISLFLLFLAQKYEGHPETSNGLFGFWVFVSISALLATSFGFRADYYGLLSLFLMAGWLTGRVLTRENVRFVMKYSVYASIVWITLGIIQKISGVATPPGWVGPEQAAFITVRIYSIFKNPNVFALYLLVILIWAYYLRLDDLNCGKHTEQGVVRTKPKLNGVLYIGIILIDLIALYFTYSRMAWFIAGMLFLYWNRNRMNSRKWLFTGGLVIACFILISDLQIRISSLLDTDSSLWQRLDIWRSVGKAIREYGWWGTGLGHFSAVYAWFGSAVAPWAQHAHNQYLQIWLENGFFSLIAFFAMIKKGVPRFFGEDLMVKAMGLAMAAFLIYGLTDTWTASPFLGGLFWLMMGFGEAGARARRLDGVHGGLQEPK